MEKREKIKKVENPSLIEETKKSSSSGGINIDESDDVDFVHVRTNERQKDLVMFLAGGDNAINKNNTGELHYANEGGKTIFLFLCFILFYFYFYFYFYFIFIFVFIFIFIFIFIFNFF